MASADADIVLSVATVAEVASAGEFEKRPLALR